MTGFYEKGSVDKQNNSTTGVVGNDRDGDGRSS